MATGISDIQYAMKGEQPVVAPKESDYVPEAAPIRDDTPKDDGFVVYKLVKNKQLIGKGCGQTSRIDSLRQAIEKSRQFNFNLNGAVMASDAFFPFNDCVKMGHEAGITSYIQPGGSIRDNDSIEYCKQHNLAMVITGMRHFRH